MPRAVASGAGCGLTRRQLVSTCQSMKPATTCGGHENVVRRHGCLRFTAEQGACDADSGEMLREEDDQSLLSQTRHMAEALRTDGAFQNGGPTSKRAVVSSRTFLRCQPGVHLYLSVLVCKVVCRGPSRTTSTAPATCRQWNG